MNNTLLKGLRLLEVLARLQSPAGVTALAMELGIGKSHAHRLLQGLVAAGYVRQDPSGGGYRASLKLWELACAMVSTPGLKSVAEPVMADLLARTRETVHLSVLDGDEVVYLHKLDSPQPVRAYSQVGGRAPAHCVATGKAMLAHQSAEVLQSLSSRLVRHSSRTVVEPEAFAREMQRVRRQGYAINRGEWRESVGGCAAAIFDASGRAIAAIGISGPMERLRLSTLRAGSADVMRAAAALTRAMGGPVD